MNLEYVLITPARNEAKYIHHTLESVASQSRLPRRWIIVDDSSTDGTGKIAAQFSARHNWIEVIPAPPRDDRDFAAKVHAFRAGQIALGTNSVDIIGCLDADVSFGEDYFEYLLARFAEDPGLGVAGTHYIEGDFHSYRDSYINPAHVNGQCQLFRRQCFEDIGGYTPIHGGGIDWVAVTTARMRGWKTASFDGRTFVHHRQMGTEGRSVLQSRFHYGKKDYFLGGHPLWQLCRGIFQMGKPPYVVGGMALLSGYAWAFLTRAPRPVSAELMAFHRREQLQRLRDLIVRRRRPANAEESAVVNGVVTGLRD